MKRDAMRLLEEWRARSDRKPLLLYGARQTGKSWLLEEFGRENFVDVAYFDLERQSGARAAFEGDLGPAGIVDALGQLRGRRIDPSSTFIVLDEIQASNRALASLKYFQQDLPGSFVAAAGSLLGVAVRREGFSAPVGKVETLTLHPMTFPEFLEATGNGLMVDAIEESFLAGTAYSLHETAMDLFWRYLLVGGLPEAVAAFAAKGDLEEVENIQRFISDLYVADMAKYAMPSETARIREAWASIPAQLAKENHKFQYKAVKNGGRASRYEAALDWLETAGLVVRCTQVTSGQAPLALHENREVFKIYQGDVGLLACSMGLRSLAIANPAMRKALDLGALVENYVAQALTSVGCATRYWVSQGTAEVDFVLESDAAMGIPVEVKSSENVRSRSLGVYCEKYRPPVAFRLSPKNFGYDGMVKSVPLYAAFCLGKHQFNLTAIFGETLK